MKLLSSLFPMPVFEGDGVTPPPPPPVAPPPAPGGSFLANVDTPPPGDTTPAAFPENWRDLIAGEDKAARPLLDRYKSPSDVGKAFREQREAISKGVKAPERPADDAPDALKAWRETMGIPADPTGYTLADPVGKRFTDAEKPQIEMFLGGMHKRDMSPTAVNAALDVYADMQEQIVGQLKASDKSTADACQDELRTEWGKEFRSNSALALQYAQQSTPGVNWFEARLPDGRLLGSVPEIIRQFADLGKARFGDTLFAGGEASKRTEDRMSEIKRSMADPKSPYNTDGGTTKGEYFELLQAKEKADAVRINTRSGAAPDRG